MSDDNTKTSDTSDSIDPETGEVVEEEIKELMENHDIDKDTAEKVQELVDEGLDEEDAVELADEL